MRQAIRLSPARPRRNCNLGSMSNHCPCKAGQSRSSATVPKAEASSMPQHFLNKKKKKKRKRLV